MVAIIGRRDNRLVGNSSVSSVTLRPGPSVTMRGMERPRFSLATMMLSMAVVASFVGSLVALVESQRYRVWGATAVEFLAAMIAVAPLWLPFVFVAFAIGRRQFSIKLVVWLVLVEIVATSLGIWVIEKSANW